MYASTQDVRYAMAPGVVGRDDPATAGSLNEDQLIDAIAEADSIVDMHVGSRYVVEQDPSDTTVATKPFRYWSRNIAAWLATLSHRRSKPIDDNDPVRIRYLQTMTLLEAVRDGAVDIPGATPIDTGDTPDGVFVYNQYEGHLFALADLGLGYSSRADRPLWWGSL